MAKVKIKLTGLVADPDEALAQRTVVDGPRL
jgi:hypothetical protein